MANDRTFHIRPVLDGQTLAAALRKLVPELSWTQVKKLVAGRHLHVNGNLCLEEDRRLRTGDVVHLFAEARGSAARPQDLRIVYMDQHIVVIDKPAGVTTTREKDRPAGGSRRHDRMPTLDELVQRAVAQRVRDMATEARRKAGIVPQRARFGQRAPVRRPFQPGKDRALPPPHLVKVPRVRAVHRLDRDTSGLMIFALSGQAEQALLKMFRIHAVDRRYLAFVHGHPAEQAIESYFVRDRGDGLRGTTDAADKPAEAKKAITHIRPVQRAGDYSVIECRLETGRTHQIRIHLLQIGHMLCGEAIYTHALGTPPVKDDSGAPRQALHSADLVFPHPVTKEPMTFTSPLPRDLEQWLRRMGQKLQPVGQRKPHLQQKRSTEKPRHAQPSPLDRMKTPRGKKPGKP